jgi:predicted TIM-barrel fold metal-dependent hydrolase
MPRKPIINTHCHLFNFEFIPQEMVKLLSHIPEKLAEQEWLGTVAGMIFALKFWDKDFDRIKQYLDTYRSKIEDVSQKYAAELTGAGIDIYTPLMMDLEEACAEQDVEPGDIPYYSNKTADQITIISQQTLANKWRMFPFVFFDPRRSGAFAICKDAIENKGFCGVKMYPALGYHPSPNIVRNLGYRGWMDEKGPTKDTERAAGEMEQLYDYCDKNHVPITVHTGTGGAYSVQLAEDPENKHWRLTEVTNWIDVIYPRKLKINFAHFGGDYMTPKDLDRAQSVAWRNQILDFIRLSKTGEMGSQVFADVSYHDMALRGQKKDRDAYFNDLKEILDHDWYGDRIMFGTDASMISHTYTEKEYLQAFKKGIPAYAGPLMSDNPIAFLFDNKKVSATYVKFVGGGTAGDLPQWVTVSGKDYLVG